MPSPSSISSDDLKYLAGFFDGEGSISIYSLGYKYSCGVESTSLKVCITSNDKTQVEYFKDAFGGDIYSEDGNHLSDNTSWTWYAYSEEAEQFIQQIQPHLREKKQQADIAKRYLNLVNERGSRVSKVEAKARRELCKQIQHLNKMP